MQWQNKAFTMTTLSTSSSEFQGWTHNEHIFGINEILIPYLTFLTTSLSHFYNLYLTLSQSYSFTSTPSTLAYSLLSLPRLLPHSLHPLLISTFCLILLDIFFLSIHQCVTTFLPSRFVIFHEYLSTYLSLNYLKFCKHDHHSSENFILSNHSHFNDLTHSHSD